MNYVDNSQALVAVGSWTPCEDENADATSSSAACSWGDRWRASPGVGLTFSTADNSQPPEVAPP
eukprot:3044495-Prymnesium_polylepis.1